MFELLPVRRDHLGGSCEFDKHVAARAFDDRAQKAATRASRAIALPLVIVDYERACAEGESVSGLRITDAAHWMTSAALSFARGLNDTSKIVALGLAAAASVGLTAPWMFGICAAASY